MAYIFTIHDAPAAAHLPLFVLQTKSMATRVFKDCVNDPSHAFSRNPADYTLFLIGTWDEEAGSINYFKTHESLGNGVQYLDNQVMPPEAPADFIKKKFEAVL